MIGIAGGSIALLIVGLIVGFELDERIKRWWRG